MSGGGTHSQSGCSIHTTVRYRAEVSLDRHIGVELTGLPPIGRQQVSSMTDTLILHSDTATASTCSETDSLGSYVWPKKLPKKMLQKMSCGNAVSMMHSEAHVSFVTLAPAGKFLKDPFFRRSYITLIMPYYFCQCMKTFVIPSCTC